MSCSRFNSRKRHTAALNDPEVRDMLATLIANWGEFPDWDRGEILINLVCCGCSGRGLAEILHCSHTTILRLMDVADRMGYRDEKERRDIRKGRLPKPDLRTWGPEKWAQCRYERTPHFIAALAERQAAAKH